MEVGLEVNTEIT